MYRVCDLCGGVDEEARHVISGVIPDEHPVNEDVRTTLVSNIETLLSNGDIDMDTAFRLNADFIDTASQDRHLPCCASAGCPSDTCKK